MKKLFGSLLLLLIIGGVASCRNELDSVDDGNNRNKTDKDLPVMKTLRLQFGGDYVVESEEPLQRAEERKTFVGINVYRTKKDSEDATSEMFAYGLFESKDGINLNILTGYTYKFESTILIEEEDMLELRNRTEYAEPFERHDATSTGFDNARGYPVADIKEGFKYASAATQGEKTFYLSQLKQGTAYVKFSGQTREMCYPRVKRFYGTLSSFDPALTDSIIIPMDYKSFGLKFILDSIPAGTSVRVSDITSNGNKFPDTDPEYFLYFPENMNLSFVSEESKTWEGIYSLNNLNQSSREFNLLFTWDKGNGETEQFSKKVTVNAKKTKVLKLKIGGSVNETKSGNIIFTQVDDELEEEEPILIEKKFK